PHPPAVAARPRRPGALFLQRLGQGPQGGDRLLRPPLQHRLHRAGEAGPGEPDAGAVRRAALFWLLAAAPTVAAPAAELRFVTCPIYRDTDAGRKSGCWLADSPEDGRRYDVTPSPTKPDWNYAVLVEGRPSAHQTDVCGGVVLDPVRVS